MRLLAVLGLPRVRKCEGTVFWSNADAEEQYVPSVGVRMIDVINEEV
jgi:hypothetical protein